METISIIIISLLSGVIAALVAVILLMRKYIDKLHEESMVLAKLTIMLKTTANDNFLRWLYYRLLNVYSEDKDYDYMLKLNEICIYLENKLLNIKHHDKITR